MATLQEAFDFDDDDLTANQQGMLSLKQKLDYQKSTGEHQQDKKLWGIYLMMALFLVGAFILINIISYANQHNLQWVLFLFIVVWFVAIILTMLFTIYQPKQPSRSKRKNDYIPVSRIRGTARLFTNMPKWNRIYFEVMTCHVRIDDGKAELAFEISQAQYEALENKARYIFYFANSQILSAEKITSA